MYVIWIFKNLSIARLSMESKDRERKKKHHIHFNPQIAPEKNESIYSNKNYSSPFIYVTKAT